jgi:hypothetical protein
LWVVQVVPDIQAEPVAELTVAMPVVMAVQAFMVAAAAAADLFPAELERMQMDFRP